MFLKSLQGCKEGRKFLLEPEAKTAPPMEYKKNSKCIQKILKNVKEHAKALLQRRAYRREFRPQ